MNSPLRIIPMTKKHIPACSAIVRASEPWKTLGESINFSAVLGKLRGLHRASIAIRKGKLVGFIIFSTGPVFARGGYIRAVGVLPEMRKQGIGQALLAFAEGVISRSSPNIYLCVSSFNRGAQMFYKSMGYVRVGKLNDLILPGISEYIYWKRIGQNLILK